METAVLVRTSILRNVVASLDQPLNPSGTAAITQQLIDNGVLSAGPDGTQGGAWAAVTELQGKLVEKLLMHLMKGEVRHNGVQQASPPKDSSGNKMHSLVHRIGVKLDALNS